MPSIDWNVLADRLVEAWYINHRVTLKKALDQSAEGIQRLIRLCCEAGGTVGGFKRDVVALLGYLIAHESHHRGSILLTAKQCGHALSEDLRWGLWSWDRI